MNIKEQLREKRAIKMTTERIKQIQAETGLPNSVLVQQALLKVWKEVAQESEGVSFPCACIDTEINDYGYSRSIKLSDAEQALLSS